jgi:stress-induced morphogen
MINDQDVIEAIKNVLPDAIVHLEALDCSKKGYSIEVKSSFFKDKPLIEQHKIIKNTLAKYLDSQVLHAVTIKTQS